MCQVASFKITFYSKIKFLRIILQIIGQTMMYVFNHMLRFLLYKLKKDSKSILQSKVNTSTHSETLAIHSAL